MGKGDQNDATNDPTGTIRFADFSQQVFGPDFVLNGKAAKKKAKKSKGASGASFRDASEMSPEKRQFQATLKRSDDNMRRVFATMNSFKELETIIQQKLFEKTGSGGMELLRLFRQFDKDKNQHIDVDEFRDALIRFNINLEERDLLRLFNHYDKSGNGEISYYDFIRHLLPGDFIPLEKLKSMGGIPGMSKRDVQRELLDAAAARAVNNAKRASVGLGSDRQIEKILRDKIMTNLSSGPYELVRMFRMFDLDGNGEIDFHEFSEVFHKFNIVIPESQMKNLFAHYDKSGKGSIGYYDFLHHVLPADFPDVGAKVPETGFSTKGADARQNAVALRNPQFAKAQKRATSYVKNAFKGHGDFVELEKILRSKIQEKTKSGGVELLRLFRQFDKDGNQAIDIDEFRETLKLYNMDLEPDDVAMMFKRYDKSGTGMIDYYEFIRYLLPNDFIPLEELKSMGGLPGMTGTDHSKLMLVRAAKVAERNVQRGQKGLALHNPGHVRTLLKDKIMMKTKGGARELWQAFRHFDKDGSGDIDFDEFRHVVVEHYNIDLPRNEVQAMFQEFLDRRMHQGVGNKKRPLVAAAGGGQSVGVASESVPAGKVTKRVNAPGSPKSAWNEGFDETVVVPKQEHPKMRRIVTKKWRLMLRDFLSIDSVDSGFATRAEVRYVLGKYNITLSDQELTSVVLKTANGLVEYRQFLSSFGAPLEGVRNIGMNISDNRPSSSMAMSAAERLAKTGGVGQGTSDTVRALRAAYDANHQAGYHRATKLSDDISATKLKTATWSFSDELDRTLKKMMTKRWKLVSNALRGQDTRRKQALHGGVFRRTLSRFGVNLNEIDMKSIRHKFGCSAHAGHGKKNLSVDYVAFLNHYAPGSTNMSARSRRLRPQSATITRARLTQSRMYRPDTTRKTGRPSSALAKSASYDPASRQMETSLTAHVRKALQIANAPADRRALKAALATARSQSGAYTHRSSGGSTSRSSFQRSRALSRGMPGSQRRPSSALARPRSSLQKSASAPRLNQVVGPSVAVTSRRDLGDNPNPKGGARTRGSYRSSRVASNGLLGRSNLMATRTINLNSLRSTNPPSARSNKSVSSLFVTPDTPTPSTSDIKLVCTKLKPMLENCWKDARKELKEADTKRTGTIPSRVFRSILSRYGVQMSENDFYTVVASFSREQEVKYDPFLRMCLR